MNKKEGIKRFKAMPRCERKALIMKKMQSFGIEVRSGITNNICK